MIVFLINLFFKKMFASRSWLIKIVFELFSVFLTVSIVYYASRSFDLKTEEASASSLFVFLMAGEVALIIPMGMAERLLGHFSEIRNSHFLLTLTGLRISPLKYVLSKTVADSFFLIIRVSTILLISKMLLNFPLSLMMIFSFFMSQLLAVSIFIFMGLVAIQFYRKFQKGMGLFYSMQTVAAILGGIYFPISIFPSYLKNISLFIPQTLILKISREIFSEKALSTKEVFGLTVWAFVFLLLWFIGESMLNFIKKRNGQLI